MATIDRAVLTVWLTSWRGAIATAAGLTLDDTPGGWGPALDEVVATNDANTNLPDRWVEPLADYWALRLLTNTFAWRFDMTSSAGAQMRLGQVPDRLLKELAIREAQVRPWLVISGAFGAQPYAGGLDRDDVHTRMDDPDAEPPLFTRRTGPPLVGRTGTRWTRYWP